MTPTRRGGSRQSGFSGSRSSGFRSGRSRGGRGAGVVRLGRDRDRGDRHDRSDGHYGRGHQGRRHRGGHNAYYYYGYPYYGFYPYFGFGSYGYAYGYGYGYYPGYRYVGYPGYGYGYVDSNVYGYFDVDVYELDQRDNYASVYPTAPLVQQSHVASRDPNDPDTGLPTDSAPTVVDSMLAEGQTAMVGGRIEDARRMFSQAMFLDDRDGRAKLLFALASLAKGEVDLAGLALRRALLTTPELIDNPWDLRTVFPSGKVGVADSEAGLPDSDAGLPAGQVFQRQLDTLARYLLDYKEHRGARLLLGYLHFGWGDAQRAHAMFSKLVLSDPQDMLAIRLRDSAARIMSQAGQ